MRKKRHGEPGPKRSRIEREKYLAELARLDLRGYSQEDIARKLGVSQPQVCYDLKVLTKKHTASQTADTKLKIDRKIRQYKEMEREAWEAWERSKNDIVEVSRVRTIGDGDEGTVREETKVKGRLPDPAYLRIIAECYRSTCELESLFPPKGAIVGVPIIDWDKLSERMPNSVPDELEDKLRQLERLADQAETLPVEFRVLPTNGEGESDRSTEIEDRSQDPSKLTQEGLGSDREDGGESIDVPREREGGEDPGANGKPRKRK